jgi:hypothetical protein
MMKEYFIKSPVRVAMAIWKKSQNSPNVSSLSTPTAFFSRLISTAAMALRPG